MCENKRRRKQNRGRSGHYLAMWWVERVRPVSSDKAIRGNLKGLAVCCFCPFFHHFLQRSYSRGHGQLWQADKEIRGLINVHAVAVGSTVGRREAGRINKAVPCSLLKRLIAVVTPLPLTGINKELVFDFVSLWGGAACVLVHWGAPSHCAGSRCCSLAGFQALLWMLKLTYQKSLATAWQVLQRSQVLKINIYSLLPTVDSKSWLDAWRFGQGFSLAVGRFPGRRRNTLRLSKESFD